MSSHLYPINHLLIYVYLIPKPFNFIIFSLIFYYNIISSVKLYFIIFYPHLVLNHLMIAINHNHYYHLYHYVFI